MVSTDPKYIYATADIVSKADSKDVKSASVGGKIQDSGNFIFEWQDLQSRYLVLTSNDGQYLTDGMDDLKGLNVRRPKKWLDEKSTPYTVNNFKGRY